LVETALLFQRAASVGGSHYIKVDHRLVVSCRHQATSCLIATRCLHSSPRKAPHVPKHQPSHRQQRQAATPSIKISPARYYATNRGGRPGPLGTAFLLFPAAAIGIGVLAGYVSLNPFSTTATGSSSSTAGMSSKLIPANPADVMVIRSITPNVVTFSVPFKRFGTIPIGGRGTVGK
jgi:hypothetical protein